MNHEPPDEPIRRRFPRRERLARRADIDRVFTEGERLRAGALLVRRRPNERAYNRVALVVGKREHGKRAVDRNRLKRLLREAYRLERARLAAGYDLVLQPARRPAGWDLALLRRLLATLLCTRGPREAPPGGADP